MALDRATILSSPGKLVHDSATLFSEGDIVADILTEFFGIETSAFGVVDQRVKDRMVKVAITPKGWADLTKLFPYATTMPGDRIFGATDKPLVITPRNGAPLTIANAMVTKLPTIVLSGTKSILGPMEYTGLVANNSDPATVANFVAFGTPATGAALTGSSFTASTVPNGLYSASWNSTTIRSKTGFTIDIALNLRPDDNDGEPTTNYIVDSIEATVRFTPISITEANYLTLLSLAKGIGASPTQSDMVITGATTGMPIVTIKNCFIESGKTAYGKEAARTGEVVMKSIRQISSNVLGALWTFGTV